MPTRLLANLNIDQLEELFDKYRTNGDMLTTLVGELSQRDTRRSRDLKRRVVSALAFAKPENFSKASPFLMTAEQHLRVAEDYRQGEPDWSDEERAGASKKAKQHEVLAKAIQKRRSKKA